MAERTKTAEADPAFEGVGDDALAKQIRDQVEELNRLLGEAQRRGIEAVVAPRYQTIREPEEPGYGFEVLGISIRRPL